MRQHLRTLDWPQVVSDVQPFIGESAAEIELLTLDNLLHVLR